MAFSKFTTTVIFALAACATATASPVKRESDPQPKDQEFALALKAEGYPALSLNIAHVAAGQSQAIFERPSAYPGTPAFLTEGDGCYLDFDVGTDYAYSMVFSEVGDNYGTKVPVYATAGGQSGRDGFSIANGQLHARMTAALQSFFVCPTTVNNEDAAGLFWGVFNSNGTAPYGCVVAELVQNFNVPGGATASYVS